MNVLSFQRAADGKMIHKQASRFFACHTLEKNSFRLASEGYWTLVYKNWKHGKILCPSMYYFGIHCDFSFEN